jgi:hypothetical protein
MIEHLCPIPITVPIAIGIFTTTDSSATLSHFGNRPAFYFLVYPFCIDMRLPVFHK